MSKGRNEMKCVSGTGGYHRFAVTAREAIQELNAAGEAGCVADKVTAGGGGTCF
jgi:hypothetical protein